MRLDVPLNGSLNGSLNVPLKEDQVDWITRQRPEISGADARKALRWSQAIARKLLAFLPEGADREEFCVEAAFRCLLAARDYDPARGAFATFASQRVRGWLRSRLAQAYYWGKARDIPLPAMVPSHLLTPDHEPVHAPWSEVTDRIAAQQEWERLSRLERSSRLARVAALPEPSPDALVSLSRRGLSNREIGRQFSRSHHWVARRLRKAEGVRP